MDPQTFSELKRISQQMLDHYILDHTILEERCLLDYGRHTIQPKRDLGALGKLPLELQHHVLGEIDVQSLLVFRRVNQGAMVIVDSMVEYQKAMTQAANSIRMAVAIETSHTFTIKQLFSKLCQKYCDRPKCGRLAAYIDVFGLTKQCVLVGLGCPFPCGPIYPGLVECRSDSNLLPAKVFRSIPGTYGHESWAKTGVVDSESHDYLYDFDEMKEALLCDESEHHFVELEELEAADDWYWKLCSVAAPWLSKQGQFAETGIFCDLCVKSPYDDVSDASFMADPSRWRLSIREEQQQYPNARSPPEPGPLPFMTDEELERHMLEKHGDDSRLEV